jgi:membrane protease YdiL (CAAX protease family)
VTAHLPNSSEPSQQCRGSFARLLGDARDLFPRGDVAVWLALGAAVLLQIGFWYYGSPGPTLLKAAPRTLETALYAVGWAAALLFLAPLAIWWGLGRPVGGLGLRLGDWRLGLPVALALALASAPALWMVSDWQIFRTTYPWSGAWPGASLGTLVAWAAIYLVYYAAFELFYRGFLLRLFEPLWGLRAAIWLQAVCATLIHLGKPWPETVLALPASLVLGLIAVRTRSLFWPVLLHFAIGMATDIASLSRHGWLLP